MTPVYASVEALRTIVAEHQHQAFVWPDEGEFNAKGVWQFNPDHIEEFEALLIDAITANMLLTVHDALNADNKAKMERMIKNGRGSFGYIVEISWGAVKPK